MQQKIIKEVWAGAGINIHSFLEEYMFSNYKRNSAEFHHYIFFVS